VKNIYKFCDELPVFNFYKIIETKDYSWLYVDFDGYNKIEITNDIDNIWESIYTEYLELTGDSTSILYYEVVKELLYLQTRYNVVGTLLQQLSMGKMSKQIFPHYVIELKKWQYNLDINKPLKEELERLARQLKSSKNRINIKEEERKSFEKKETGEKLSLIQQQVKLEQALSRNEIDTKKTVVSKWIAMIKEVKAINQERKNKNGK